MEKVRSKISLFFTLNVSLKVWDESGIFQRETKPYIELAKRSYEITFYTWGNNDDLQYSKQLEGIKIIPLQKNTSRKSKFSTLLYSLIVPILYYSEIKGTLIKTNQMWGSWTPLICHWITGAPLVARVGYDLYDFHLNKGSSFLKRSLVFMLSRLTYQSALSVLTTSRQTAKNIEKNFKVNPSKIHHHPNYIDINTFSKKPVKEILTNYCIYVGRLDKHKNLDLALHFIKLNKFSLTIVGDGEEKEHLQKLATELEVSEKVEFLGKVQNHNLPSILKKHDFFILFSKSEGSPKALLEAMSCGLVPIASDVPGINNIITNKENGILINTRNLKSSKIIIKDEEYDSMSNKAVNYVKQNCSLSSLLDLEESLYKRH